MKLIQCRRTDRAARHPQHDALGDYLSVQRKHPLRGVLAARG